MIERKCKKCGKNFIPAYYHVYKDGGKIYCSWTCYNHRNDSKVKKEAKYKVVEVCDKDGSLIRAYKSAIEAAEQLGFCINNIRKACVDGSEYNGFLWKYKEVEQ